MTEKTERDHLEKLTIEVSVNIPGHEDRVATSLFERTRLKLIEREGARCYVSGMTAEESGHPLEAHHHPVERSFANMVDWPGFAAQCLSGKYGPHAQAFDWAGFFGVVHPSDIEPGMVPKDVYAFVDDMTVNGLLLSKQFHTGKDEGIHCLPYPIWIAQKFGRDGYNFSDIEIIHHSGQEPQGETK